MKEKPAYQRILLKVSGESLLGSQAYGVDPVACERLATSVAEVRALGVEVGLVIGGGNIFRGIKATESGLERAPADHMGMLATVMNGIALSQAFEKIGCPFTLLSAIPCGGMVAEYSRLKALEVLHQKAVALFVGGTGNPFFTTDSAAALRALEINAQILFKATKVDGIFDRDPLKFPQATKYDRVSYANVLRQQLNVMDFTAIALCEQYKLRIRVFNFFSEHALRRAVLGDSLGTLVEE